MPCAPPFRPVFVLLGLLALTACGGAPPGPPPSATSAARAADPDFDQMMRVARSTAAAGDYGAAIPLYRRAQSLAPDRPEPSLALGALAWDVGDAEASLHAYQAALNAAPKEAEALRGAGRAELALGRIPAALASYRAGLAVAPTDVRLHNGLAVALDRSGDHQAALRTFGEGLAIAPNDLDLRGNLGLSHALHDEFEQALPLLEAVAADPRAGERQRANLQPARDLQAKAAAKPAPSASAP